MRLSLSLVSILVASAPSPGRAQAGPAAPTASTVQPAPEPRPYAAVPELRQFGLQLDVGWPGGGAVELVYRPIPSLRASAGPAFNVLGFGVRVGVGFVPWQTWSVTPTFNLDYGHFFSGDLNKVVDASTPEERAVLRDAAYDWVAGTVGVEFGSQQGFAFYLRGGLTFLWANVPGADATALARSASGNSTITSSDVKVRGLLPAFSLGFIWYLL